MTVFVIVISVINRDHQFCHYNHYHCKLTRFCVKKINVFSRMMMMKESENAGRWSFLSEKEEDTWKEMMT